jgi:hypothetical protein
MWTTGVRTAPRLPLRGEVPHCRRNDRTPYDRRELVAIGALLVHVALVCIDVATA